MKKEVLNMLNGGAAAIRAKIRQIFSSRWHVLLHRAYDAPL
jgi:hypothetical protein